MFLIGEANRDTAMLGTLRTTVEHRYAAAAAPERSTTTDEARQLKANGLSFAACAEQLTEEGVPTAHGAQRWYPSTVRKVLLSADRAGAAT